jgi:titin
VLVGGTTPGAQNVISGNGYGVSIGSGLGDPNVSHNRVEGNLIGTNVTGAGALGNTQHGIAIVTPNNTVGGTTPEARNVISGNGTYGVYLFSADSNIIQGNYIGTNITGDAAIGNHTGGIYLVGNDVTIGGTSAGEGNIIAFNGTLPNHPGIEVIDPSFRNAILGNSIFENAGLGIDQGGNGVTPNDSCDADTLVANNYQNYPVLTSALPAIGNTIIQGTLNSRPNSLFRVEFFATPTPDSTGYGEGKIFLGSTTVTTGNNCQVSFVDTLPDVGPLGNYITSTATDAWGNTSEFSRSILLGTTSAPEKGRGLPTRFGLSQNYPNPFNPSTTINYQLPMASRVILTIYNILGQEVTKLVEGVQGAGYKSAVWNGQGVASGVYYCRIVATSGQTTFVDVKKMLVMK